MNDRRASGNLLLIEDNAELSLWLGKSLRLRGLAVEFATDGITADRMLRAQRWDLVILDLSLPGLDGLDVLRRLRAHGDAVPVLILTARADVPDKVRGLKLGADDYLTKPFDLSELEARVEALLRRPRELRTKRATIGELTLDYEQSAFYRGDVPLSLSKREREVMDLVVSGLLNKQVAGNLGISEVTVKAHRGQVMRKMRARSLADLVKMASRLGVTVAQQG